MKKKLFALSAVSALISGIFAPSGPTQAAPVLVNYLSVSGSAADATNPQTCATPGSCTANENRLSFGSDLYYDRFSGSFIGLADRGPGGGLVSYDTRFHGFSLNVNSSTGEIGAFNVTASPQFSDLGARFNGLLPNPAGTLGNSHDPEGVVTLPNGNVLVSDEYGPSLREFNRSGQLVRTFTTPANLMPRQGNGDLNYVAGRTTIVTGRQDNRGFEGLAISPDNSKLYAIMQDPLVNEGSDGDADLLDGEGRRSRNLRIVEFSMATGQSTAQYIYQLEPLADINARIPGTANDFAANQQGRSIGASAIVALNDTEFLVLERDNRGFGADPTTLLPIGSKRVYRISLAGATNVAGIPLDNTNTLPAGVNPVQKSLYMDVADALTTAGLVIPEKIEGLTVGPQLLDGRYLLLMGTDNDFSVTQSGTGEQFDVCTNGTDTTLPTATSTDNPLGGGCPQDQSLVPSYLYAFAVDFQADGIDFRAQAPLPGTLSLVGIGIAGAAAARRRRDKRA